MLLSLDYGDLKVEAEGSGGGQYRILEFQRSDGSWGYVCSSGFDYRAAELACKQLGYNGNSYHTER